jgi:Protein of unknown function (DUF2490)
LYQYFRIPPVFSKIDGIQKTLSCISYKRFKLAEVLYNDIVLLLTSKIPQNMKTLFFILFLFLAFLSSQAQHLRLFGVSSNYLQTGKITKKLNYNIHVASIYNASPLKVGEKAFTTGHTHFVPHLVFNYKITDKISVGTGYAFGRHDIFGLRENEHRAILQGIYNQKIQKFNLSHRGRYEFRSPLNLKTNIRSNASIFRYQLGVNFPFYNPKTSKQGLYLTAGNEMFFYLKGAENGPVSSKNGQILSENWANIALGYNDSKCRYELGYGFQKLVRNKQQDNRYFNLLQLTVASNINWDNVLSWYY